MHDHPNFTDMRCQTSDAIKPESFSTVVKLFIFELLMTHRHSAMFV